MNNNINVAVQELGQWMIVVDCRLESRIIICLLKTIILDSYDKNIHNYYTPLSFFLYKNMTVVLLFHPKINRIIPPVVPIKICRTISLCGNFSNHISRNFLSHSSHWFELNDVYNGMILSPTNRGQMAIFIQKRKN